LKTYEWNHPVLKRANVDAARVHDEIEQIELAAGAASVDDIIERARDPDTELHKAFAAFKAWDDEHAAAQFRKTIARTITRSVRLRIVRDEQPEQVKRVYVRPSTATGYKSISRVKLSITDSEAMRHQAAKELYAWIQRYEELVHELPGFRSQLDMLVKKLRRGVEVADEAAE
jgi:hypothetical protein